ncbi:MAG: hypothetical protein AVDCRST_MAG50-1080 [uncultured Acidimicrobiales bacterium]|uniref:Mycothiol-dependent maleylpyruvate isomerase metal-binding domain-containing protein n=1 Tax=uncultured Acidimicrobiales bacterium TaxID=310071 RepID=A0A6J4HQ91_9ACTN|nr:MAG: hypothetical protein AVDCRST_MAG50-1080 [uncultured Acidimicrobiales bacterium]
MDERLSALRTSVIRLRYLAGSLGESDLTRAAYPSEWTVADVLSHLGSGAVIMRRRLEDGLTGTPTPEDFAPSVWETWNAKSPAEQAADALAADAAVLQRIEAVSAAERAELSFPLGPMTLDFDGFVGLRMNEHTLHTWDIEVATDPAATIPDELTEAVIDNLDFVARFAAKPTGDTQTVTVRTTAPVRGYSIDSSPEKVSFARADADQDADLTMPAEAFVRLVYGRLDPDHTPPVDGARGTLAVLRRTFPGF